MGDACTSVALCTQVPKTTAERWVSDSVTMGWPTLSAGSSELYSLSFSGDFVQSILDHCVQPSAGSCRCWWRCLVAKLVERNYHKKKSPQWFFPDHISGHANFNHPGSPEGKCSPWPQSPFHTIVSMKNQLLPRWLFPGWTPGSADHSHGGSCLWVISPACHSRWTQGASLLSWEGGWLTERGEWKNLQHPFNMRICC